MLSESTLGVAAHRIGAGAVHLEADPAVGTSWPHPSLSIGHWRGWVAALDALAAVSVLALGAISHHGPAAERWPLWAFPALAGAASAWVGLLALQRVFACDRFLGPGSEEFRGITRAALWALAAVMLGSHAFHAELSAERLLVTIPALSGLTVVIHAVARWRVRLQLKRGAIRSRVVVVGTPSDASRLVEHMSRVPEAGLQVIGLCSSGRHTQMGQAPDLPLLGGVEDAADAAARAGADTIAIAGSEALSEVELRRLSWRLEGRGMRLLVAPAVTELAGPRIGVLSVGGLPLLHVREPEFSGTRRTLKAVIDRTAAAVLLLALGPLLAAIAVAVRAESPGSVLFRQTRVGRDGRPFTLLKFRTMYLGADADRERISHLNEHDGVLFKVRRDPRVTSVGRLLRRLSLDELPQLWNVLTGSMSLVGPRPPLPCEVERYSDDVRRRLLVKPGITGLWQVSGRSDLSWVDTVRLDLFYVEHWSVRFDAWLIWRTVAAVISGRGAY